jgi:hypothetical protein
MSMYIVASVLRHRPFDEEKYKNLFRTFGVPVGIFFSGSDWNYDSGCPDYSRLTKRQKVMVFFLDFTVPLDRGGIEETVDLSAGLQPNPPYHISIKAHS